MYSKPVGISILTNAARLDRLKTCVSSFLSNCYYRPLVIAIFDNGSTDNTRRWMAEVLGLKVHGVTWRMDCSGTDLGCAAGTNRSLEMVKDCEYAMHVESDFQHLPEEWTGEDKMWMRRALDLLGSGEADYLYLRRMADERDIFLHWWSQWMSKVDMTHGRFMRMPGFWWSNNPTLFRNETMYGRKVLPLDEKLDGAKGTPGWSKPELAAPRPGKAWIHRWGLFVHEDLPAPGAKCCPDGCKYGFFNTGEGAFCEECDRSKGYQDMQEHADRYAGRMKR